MRISTNTLYATGISRLSELQSGIVKTQQQISTGHRILTPSDDPVGAARALDLTQSQSINTQFGANRQAVSNALSTEEGVLQGTTSLLQDTKTLAISAGNGALNDSDRAAIATDLRGRLDALISQANATDGTGNYIFAGFQVTNPPFSSAATGAQYTGDQGQRLVQVATSRQMGVSDPGDAVFQNITNTGALSVTPTAGNGGSVSASAVTVDGSVPLTGHDYKIVFNSATTYTVTDATLGTTGPGQTYTSGQQISIDGQQLTLSGAPANGDSFKVGALPNQSVFKTIGDLITALQTPATTAAQRTNLTHSLQVAGANLDNALNNVLTVRASIGSRLKEIDSLNTSGDDRNLQFATSLSQIQDVDYNKAISDFTQQNTNLEAAQKTFVKVSSLSLFSLL
jgi:flagellar hook-associated protein 3 FlgL